MQNLHVVLSLSQAHTIRLSPLKVLCFLLSPLRTLLESGLGRGPRAQGAVRDRPIVSCKMCSVLFTQQSCLDPSHHLLLGISQFLLEWEYKCKLDPFYWKPGQLSSATAIFFNIHFASWNGSASSSAAFTANG